MTTGGGSPKAQLTVLEAVSLFSRAADVAGRIRQIGIRSPELDPLLAQVPALVEGCGGDADVRENALGALLNLAPAVVRDGDVEPLRRALGLRVARGPLNPTEERMLPDLYRNAVEGLATGGPRDRMMLLLELAEEVARLTPAASVRWSAFATACYRAARLWAGNGDFASVKLALDMLGRTPDAFANAAVPAMAETGALCSVQARIQGKKAEADKADAFLAALWERHSTGPVAEAYAEALAHDMGARMEAKPSDYRGALKDLSGVRNLVAAFPGRRGLGGTLARCSFPALLLKLPESTGALQELLADFSLLAGWFPGDETLAGDLAKGVVQALDIHLGVQHEKPAGSWLGNIVSMARGTKSDPIVDALRETMADLVACCPASPAIAQWKARFQGLDGGKALAPAASHRQTGARAWPGDPKRCLEHPTLVTLRQAFGRLQRNPGDAEALTGLRKLFGSWSYLPRIVDEGDKIYATAEPYFLDLLDEISEQLFTDKSGFWKQHAGGLETVTRYAIEDATPMIADAARTLRRRLRMPEV